MAPTPTPTGAGDNHRIDSAIFRTEIAHLRADIEIFRRDWQKWCDRHDEKHEQSDKERKALGERITRNEERISSGNRVLGSLSVIGSAIAGVVGSLVK